MISLLSLFACLKCIGVYVPSNIPIICICTFRVSVFRDDIVFIVYAVQVRVFCLLIPLFDKIVGRSFSAIYLSSPQENFPNPEAEKFLAARRLIDFLVFQQLGEMFIDVYDELLSDLNSFLLDKLGCRVLQRIVYLVTPC